MLSAFQVTGDWMAQSSVFSSLSVFFLHWLLVTGYYFILPVDTSDEGERIKEKGGAEPTLWVLSSYFLLSTFDFQVFRH